MLTEAASMIPDALSSSRSTPSETPSEGGDLAALDQEEPKAVRLGGLVLTRHLGESIMIGEDVEVQVVGAKSGTARLKVLAPRSIPVHRREIFDAIRSGNVPIEPSPASATPPVVTRPGKPTGGLVLARSARQSIMIGEDVEIGVVEVRPSTVKLRISAPRSVPVHRREVFDSLKGGQD